MNFSVCTPRRWFAPEPIVEIGAFQVAGQEAIYNLRPLLPGYALISTKLFVPNFAFKQSGGAQLLLLIGRSMADAGRLAFTMQTSPKFTVDLPGVKKLPRGKVREIFDLGETLLFVATDRLSAFDVVLPDPIPHKGAVLNQLSAFWFKRFDNSDIRREQRVKNHFKLTEVCAAIWLTSLEAMAEVLFLPQIECLATQVINLPIGQAISPEIIRTAFENAVEVRKLLEQRPTA